MPVIAIGTAQPYPIAGVGTDYKGFTVQNSGSSRLYFGHDPSVSPQSFGNFVDPGGSIAWPQGSPCYVIAGIPGGQINYSPLTAVLSGSASGTVSLAPGSDVGVTGTVDTNITNAVVPVSGNVNATIQNAVIPVNGTVSANILNASIPVSGAVNINAGNVSVNGSVSLLHSQDVLFSSASVALAIGNTTLFDTAGAVDLSKYSTIYVAIAQAGTYGFIELNTATESYYDHASGKAIVNSYTWMKAGGISWFSNVVGSSFKVVVSNSVAVTNVSVLVIGMSSDEVPRATIYPITNPPQGGATNMTFASSAQLPGFYGFDVSQTAAGQGLVYPIFTTGPNHLSNEMPNASGYTGYALEYYVTPLLNAGRIQQFTAGGGYTSIPNIPVSLRAWPVVFATSTSSPAGARFISTLTSDLGPVNTL